MKIINPDVKSQNVCCEKGQLDIGCFECTCTFLTSCHVETMVHWALSCLDLNSV